MYVQSLKEELRIVEVGHGQGVEHACYVGEVTSQLVEGGVEVVLYAWLSGAFFSVRDPGQSAKEVAQFAATYDELIKLQKLFCVVITKDC